MKLPDEGLKKSKGMKPERRDELCAKKHRDAEGGHGYHDGESYYVGSKLKCPVFCCLWADHFRHSCLGVHK